MSLRRFLNEHRVGCAQNPLLSESAMTMAQIATVSGFQSVRSFKRAFREIAGCEPRGYSAGRSPVCEDSQTGQRFGVDR